MMFMIPMPPTSNARDAVVPREPREKLAGLQLRADNVFRAAYVEVVGFVGV
jgi:hypothetical protein